MKMKLPLPKPPINNQINQKNIAQLNQKLNQLSGQFKAATAKGAFEEAHKAVSQVLKLVPNHVVAMMDLAYTELRLGRYDDAYKHYHQVIKLNPKATDTNVYDGLAEVCHYLGKKDELRQYGAAALNSKKQQVENQTILKIITEQPPHFNPENPSENIIAFSLFGANPRYCETSVINVDLAKEIYPEWICRFYVDESVPQSVCTRLQDKGAQVILVNEEQKKISGLFWRFFVMDDASVKRFLIRDADSLVSYREKAAVDEWLKSDKWFHTMHDYYSHTELILAGMWGGCHGVFHLLEPMIDQYLKAGNYLNTRVADQHFLRFCIWPTVKQSVLLHDSQGFDIDAQDFPDYQQKMEHEHYAQFHVGMNEGSSMIVAEVKSHPNQKVHWTLVDEQGQEVCKYEQVVNDAGQLQIDMPRKYAEYLKQKTWKIQVNPIENID